MEEPAWPELACVPEGGDTVPFVPPWIRSPRVHHLLPETALDPGSLWTCTEQKRAADWLEERLHFRIADHPECWGSVHLVAPNPVFRDVDVRLHVRENGAESILVRFHPRSGRSVAGLELLLREQEPWGVTVLLRVAIHEPLLRLDFDRGVRMTSLEVVDPRRGPLLLTDGVTAFARQIVTGVAIARTLVVHPPDEPTFEVVRTRSETVVSVGRESTADGARRRMHEAFERRRIREAGKRLDQRWFRGQKDEARAVIRRLLHGAKVELRLVDPYFAADELFAIPLALGREGVPIRILTSAEALKEPARRAKSRAGGRLVSRLRTRSGPGRARRASSRAWRHRQARRWQATWWRSASRSGPPIREEGERLLAALEDLGAQGYPNRVDVRVMLGRRPPVHDRFLVVDHRAWLLGSSFQEFGERGTMMVALPDPAPVRRELERAWEEAQELQAWVEGRRARVRGADGAS